MNPATTPVARWRSFRSALDRLQGGDFEEAPRAVEGLATVLREVRHRRAPLNEEELAALAALVASGSLGVATLMTQAADAVAHAALELRSATADLAAELADALEDAS